MNKPHHIRTVSKALDQLICDERDVELCRAWFRCIDSEKLALALYPVFAEVMEQEGFVHPARWLKDQGQ